MREKLYILFICLLSMLKFTPAFTQQRNIFAASQSSFKQAEKYYKNNDYMSAIVLYKKALNKERLKQGHIKLRLADSYRNLRFTSEAERWYREIINNKHIVGPQDIHNYAMVLLSNKKYDASKAWFEHYNNEYGADSVALRKIKGIEQITHFYADSLSTPVNWLALNTIYSEFSPVYYNDGLLFSSTRQSENIVQFVNDRDHQAFLNLYYCSFKTDSSFLEPKPWRYNNNSSYHEGPVVFYENQTKAIVTQNFSSNKKAAKNNRLTLGLYFIEKANEHKWNEGVPFDFNDDNFSIAQPAVNQTGTVLYFASNKPGGYGGSDLYKCIHDGTNWTEPVNLGPAINTSGDEMFPYLSQDSILYFSSNGHEGLGGLDIYRSYLSGTTFGKPENIGYPINSSQDDFGIVFSPDEKSGYFSSNRINEGLDDDLFSFEIIQVQMKGVVKSKLKNTPLSDVVISLSLKNKEVLSTQTNAKGEFQLLLDASNDYTLSAYKENYKLFTCSVSSKNRGEADTIRKEIVMEKEVKTLVKGVVKQNNKEMGAMKIIALETETGHQDTILSDDKGEFFYEADPALEYYFFVDTKHSFGDVMLEPSKKTKGTFLLYTKIELHNYDTSFVNVVVKDKNIPVTNALVVVENTVTKKCDSVYTNKKGSVRFVAKSYADYSISCFYKSKTARLPDYNLTRNKARTLVLHLKEEE